MVGYIQVCALGLVIAVNTTFRPKIVPKPASFENMFSHLTYSAMAAGSTQYQVGLPAQSKTCICWGDQKLYQMAYGEVIEVVADEGGSGW